MFFWINVLYGKKKIILVLAKAYNYFTFIVACTYPFYVVVEPPVQTVARLLTPKMQPTKLILTVF
jgi:hypothetical protein